MLATERWATIPGHPGYEASDQGRVRSRRGILTGSIAYPGGYRWVHIMVNGERAHRAVHRLILLAYQGPPPEGHETRHLDGDVANNALSNLTWGTHAENNQDRVRHGTHHHAAKTACVNGHEFTPENTYRPARGGRQCRACARERDRRRTRRK